MANTMNADAPTKKLMQSPPVSSEPVPVDGTARDILLFVPNTVTAPG